MTFKTIAASNRALAAALLVALPLVTFVPNLALANDAVTADAVTEAEKAVETVIVVGRSDAPISVTPRGLAVSLGSADFAAVNALNVEDLMKYAPNFFVRKRYIGDANGVPGFRGTHSTQSARSYILVDGFVVSNFLGNSFGFAPKWGVVGPGEVRQFDVVYGPYSSRYPGNSMGGVVSITTRAPQGNEAFVNAQAFSQSYKQYGTDDVYVGGTFEAGIGLAPKDSPLKARLSWRHFENIGQPQSWFQFTPVTGGTNGVAVTGAFVDPKLITPTPIFAAEAAPITVQDQIKLRADLALGGDWMAQGLIAGWQSSFDTTKPQTYLTDTNGAPIWSGRVRFNDTNWTLPAISLGLTQRMEYLIGLKMEGTANDWNLRGNLSTYIIGKNETRASSTYASGIANGIGRLTAQRDTGWTTLDLFAERTFGKWSLALGGNASRYRFTQEVFSTTNWREASGQAPTNRTGGQSALSGIFAEASYEVSDRVQVTGGLRRDQWQASKGILGAAVNGQLVTQNYATREDNAINPTLSATWAIAPQWSTQLSLATATRFPTVSELFQGTLLSDGSFNVNSFDPNLKPEQSRDTNLLLRYTLDKTRVTGSAFWQEVDDTIFSVQGFNQFGLITNSFKNIDKVRQQGLELIVETTDLLIKGLSVDANVAWIDAKTIKNAALPASEGVAFPRIPDWRINGNMRYKSAHKWGASFSWRYASRPNTNLTGTQRGDTFGYASEQFIIDTRFTYDITDKAQIALGIDNLNNDKAWAFHPFPQRTVLLEVKWRQ